MSSAALPGQFEDRAVLLLQVFVSLPNTCAWFVIKSISNFATSTEINLLWFNFCCRGYGDLDHNRVWAW